MRRVFNIRVLLTMCAVLVAPVAARAVPTDPMIEGAKECTRHLSRYERQYGIPVHLLSAIASTESGRWHKGLGITLPWPWTINAEGKGYYYDTKQEAILAAKRMRAAGVKSMDLGCMQVNTVHHADAFASIEEAFNPENNVAYAAYFLKNLFDEQHSWKAAAAAYHSRTSAHGVPYVGKVYDRWYTIIDRVRAARISMATAAGTSGLTAEEAAAAREASRETTSAPVRLVKVTAPAQGAPRSTSRASMIKVSGPGGTVSAPVRSRSSHVVSVKNTTSAPSGARSTGPVLVSAPKAVKMPESPAPTQEAAVIPEVEVKPVGAVPMPAITAETAAARLLPPARSSAVASAAAPSGQNVTGPRFIFRD